MAGTECLKDEVKGHVQLKVPTCIQTYTWDCGLACACMVLRYFGINDYHVYTSDLEELKCGESLIFTCTDCLPSPNVPDQPKQIPLLTESLISHPVHSIWTIDLAFLLHKYRVKLLFTTITLGVDKGYSKKAFYMNHFDKDEERVNQLFVEAKSKGIQVEKRSITMEEIISHLSLENLVICLVNWTYLQCIWCDGIGRNCLSCFRNCCSTYQGHYVVVCGYDRKKKYIYYKNPSYDEDVCCSRLDKFEKARKSYGTDMDTLLLYKDQYSKKDIQIDDTVK